MLPAFRKELPPPVLLPKMDEFVGGKSGSSNKEPLLRQLYLISWKLRL
jgi:hypothetical protein